METSERDPQSFPFLRLSQSLFTRQGEPAAELDITLEIIFSSLPPVEERDARQRNSEYILQAAVAMRDNAQLRGCM